MSSTIFSTDTKRISKKLSARGDERTLFEEKDTFVARDNGNSWDSSDTCKPQCPPPPCKEEVYIQKVKKVPQCDPCGRPSGGRKGFYAVISGIIVAIIIGIGFWIIKPDWVLKKDQCGNVINPCCIDWLKLIIWAIVATIVIFLIIWILSILFAGIGASAGGFW